jgi:hypothetical protein
VTLAPFARDIDVDEPAIVGARWWNESVKAATTRRQVLLALAVGTAGVAIGGAIYGLAKSSPEVRLDIRDSLEMQRSYGWNFGAESVELPTTSDTPIPADRAELADLVSALEPARSAHHPHYVPTLFEVPPATPRLPPPPEGAPSRPYIESAHSVYDPLWDQASIAGSALAASIKAGATPKVIAGVIVDLPGPLSVAFAAGASDVLDPIFLFDNWPHPRGVVAAHQTIEAIAHYRGRFLASRAYRGASPPPMFVLDRNRLAPYSDDESTFDNRHLARLPSLAELQKLGVSDLIYVAPTADNLELDDLNDALCDAKDKLKLFKSTAYGTVTPFTPTPRVTPFSRAVPVPTAVGKVPILIAVETGVVLGAKMHRSGSWNRSDGSSFGGG